MNPELHLVETAPLPYLLSLPDTTAPPHPLLLFLHGYDEGAPLPLQGALTRHGPLAPTTSPSATREFIVVAPQLPTRGDLWHQYAEAVEEIVQEVQARHPADPERTFLTGFSYGGNGVFDLALQLPDLWVALWPVDPTRVPQRDPEKPVWFSSGEISRRQAPAFMQRLRLEELSVAGTNPGERVYTDEGQDHVGTARRAYGDERVYRWLLSLHPAA